MLILPTGCATSDAVEDTGCVSGDCHTGHGKYTLSNGTLYEGEWMYNSLYGQGTITFPDGARYIGKIKNSKPHGKGIFIETDGSQVEGYFRNGRFTQKNIDDSAVESVPQSAAAPQVTQKEIKQYCTQVGNANGGSYQVEAACLEMAAREAEITARATLNAMELTDRIDRFCQSVADKNQGSFSTKLDCVQQEIAARERLR